MHTLHVYVYTYIHIYVYIHKYTLEIIIDLPIGFPINNIISLNIHAYIYTYKSICMYTYIYICIYIYIHLPHPRDESWHTFEVVISHTSHSCQWVTSDMRVHRYLTHHFKIINIKESCHMYEWDMAHIWTRHVTHMDEAWHTHERVVAHVWMSHITHLPFPRLILGVAFQHTLQYTPQHTQAATHIAKHPYTHSFLQLIRGVDHMRDGRYHCNQAHGRDNKASKTTSRTMLQRAPNTQHAARSTACRFTWATRRLAATLYWCQ